MKIQTPNRETQTILDIIALLGLRMSLWEKYKGRGEKCPKHESETPLSNSVLLKVQN